jgi:hypothetical protein
MLAFVGLGSIAIAVMPALEAGRNVCWYSWPEQKRSVERLAAYDFTWVVPGHGRRWRAESAHAMHAELARVAAAM